MTNHKYKNKYDPSQNTVSQHTSHLVHNRCDNTGGKSQSQKSGIGKDITYPACNVIKIVGSRASLRNGFFLSLPDMKRIPTAPMIAIHLPICTTAAGRFRSICEIERNMLLGIKIRISPIRSMNQSTTSQKKSRYFCHGSAYNPSDPFQGTYGSVQKAWRTPKVSSAHSTVQTIPASL